MAEAWVSSINSEKIDRGSLIHPNCPSDKIRGLYYDVFFQPFSAKTSEFDAELKPVDEQAIKSLKFYVTPDKTLSLKFKGTASGTSRSAFVASKDGRWYLVPCFVDPRFIDVPGFTFKETEADEWKWEWEWTINLAEDFVKGHQFRIVALSPTDQQMFLSRARPF